MRFRIEQQGGDDVVVNVDSGKVVVTLGKATKKYLDPNRHPDAPQSSSNNNSWEDAPDVGKTRLRNADGIYGLLDFKNAQDGWKKSVPVTKPSFQQIIDAPLSENPWSNRGPAPAPVRKTDAAPVR